MESTHSLTGLLDFDDICAVVGEDLCTERSLNLSKIQL
jgi:hypothetical protein